MEVIILIIILFAASMCMLASAQKQNAKRIESMQRSKFYRDLRGNVYEDLKGTLYIIYVDSLTGEIEYAETDLKKEALAEIAIEDVDEIIRKNSEGIVLLDEQVVLKPVGGKDD